MLESVGVLELLLYWLPTTNQVGMQHRSMGLKFLQRAARSLKDAWMQSGCLSLPQCEGPQLAVSRLQQGALNVARPLHN